MGPTAQPENPANITALPTPGVTQPQAEAAYSITGPARPLETPTATAPQPEAIANSWGGPASLGPDVAAATVSPEIPPSPPVAGVAPVAEVSPALAPVAGIQTAEAQIPQARTGETDHLPVPGEDSPPDLTEKLAHLGSTEPFTDTTTPGVIPPLPNAPLTQGASYPQYAPDAQFNTSPTAPDAGIATAPIVEADTSAAQLNSDLAPKTETSASSNPELEKVMKELAENLGTEVAPIEEVLARAETGLNKLPPNSPLIAEYRAGFQEAVAFSLSHSNKSH